MSPSDPGPPPAKAGASAPGGAGPDWGLVAGWSLGLGLVFLVFYSLFESPLVDPFGNLNQFIRLLRAVLVVPLVFLLTYLLITRSRSAVSTDQRSLLLLELAPSGVFLADEAGIIRRAGAGAGPILGYRPAELVDHPLDEIVAPVSREAFRALVAESRDRGVPMARELRGQRRDRSECAVEVTVLERTILRRPVLGVYLRDLSERERLVDALAVRAAELARSNRDLEQFAYVASHDLQEPIRMVGSFTELLQRRYGPKLDADANEFLEFARQGAARMRELVDALLSYSRLDTRGEPFRKVPLEAVYANALANLREAIASRSAEVTRGPLPEIEGDATQLTQLFQNLIGNALKFHDPSTPHVHVEAVRQGPDWRLTVHDDGIGISPEYHDRIFAIFQRLHTREEYAGSGIGLSVCKRVVERHGGRIGVESTGSPGEGTTFFFTVPAERRPVPVPTPVEAAVVDTRIRREAQSLIEDRLRDLV